MKSRDSEDVVLNGRCSGIPFGCRSNKADHHKNMLTPQGQRVKTDARDALMIAQCLSYGGYHAVYIITAEDDSVKEYLRMRDDNKTALKKIKQVELLRPGNNDKQIEKIGDAITYLRESRQEILTEAALKKIHGTG